MKRAILTLIASTALTSFGATAAHADPDIFVGIGAGPGSWTDEHNGVAGNNESTFNFSGMTSAEYNFTPNLGAQGDLVLRHQNTTNSGGYELQTSTIDGALHGFYRDPDNFLLGGFVQLGKLTATHETITDKFVINRGLAGVEGQVFLDQLTLYSQGGLQQWSNNFSSEKLQGWFVTSELRYFLTPDLKISVNAGLSQLRLDVDKTRGYNTFNLGLGGEYKLADMPVSIFGAYDFMSTTMTDHPYTVDSHRLTVGLKFNMGEETLQARDRNGASLKPVEFSDLGYGGNDPWGYYD